MVDFSMEEAEEDLSGLNPNSHLLPLSARTNEGLDTWIQWVEDAYKKCAQQN